MNVVGLISDKSGKRRTKLVLSFIEGCYVKKHNVRIMNVNDITDMTNVDILVSYGCRSELVSVLNQFNHIPSIRIYDPPIRPLGKLERDFNSYYGVTWNNFHRGYVYDDTLDSERWINLKKRYDITIKPWSTGNKILLVYQPSVDFFNNSRVSFFKQAANICLDTGRKVVICNRPKSSNRFKFKGCKQCVGVDKHMNDLFCIVSSGGTSVSKGIINGVSSFSNELNITTPLMGSIPLEEFLNKRNVPDRTNWFNWIAYQQWTTDEMQCGEPMQYLVGIKNEAYKRL